MTQISSIPSISIRNKKKWNNRSLSRVIAKSLVTGILMKSLRSTTGYIPSQHLYRRQHHISRTDLQLSSNFGIIKPNISLIRLFRKNVSSTLTICHERSNDDDSSSDSDEDEWRALIASFQMYKAAYGDLKVPSRFVVPSMPPWPGKFYYFN